MNWKRLKKFSTATLLCSASVSLSFAATKPCEFSEQAPEAHLVVAGDTLWELAAQFLKDPWCWPQVWGQNRPLIQDPHWIYPGQTIYFKRTPGQLSLSSEIERHNDSQHLSPRIRNEPISRTALPVLAPLLQLQLTQAPILWSGILPATPSIAAITDDHAMAGRYDTVFVKGELGPHRVFDVVRTAEPVTDPIDRRVIAYTAVRIGTLTLQQAAAQAGELHRFTVTASSSELRPGDALIAFQSAASTLPVMHPAFSIDGHIAAVLRGSRWANQYDLVAINRGRQHGLDTGSVLSVMKQAKIGAHDSGKETIDHAPLALPAQEIGTLLVFQVAELVSLALVIRSSDGITIGDAVQSADRGTR